LLSILPRSWNVVASLGLPDAYTQALTGSRLAPAGQGWINTIFPLLLVVFLLQMPIVYTAALGIGAMRPLGKRSELLLLLFSPWLFVTIGPLSPAAYLIARQLGLLDTTVALFFPSLFSVPVLFILTLFFKGQEPGWRAALAEGQSSAKAFFSALILPSLPLAILLACASLLFSMQDLLWPLLVSSKPDRLTMVLVLAYLARSGAPMPVLAASIVLFGLPVFLFFFLVFGLFQALYLDRLALVAGRRDGAGAFDEPSPEEDVAEEVVVTDGSEPEGAMETVRLEMEEERKTVRLEPEGAKKTVRLEPEGKPKNERKTVRLELEEERKTVRLEPEGAKKTVRLEPEGKPKNERKTVRLEREEDDNQA
jgi:ABC-type glycerol-3-phosphate transport system permease component